MTAPNGTEHTANRGCPAEQWIARLDAPDAAVRSALAAVYGPIIAVLDERKALLKRVLIHFAGNYGDAPVRVFRAPGRINLRGMHVDTHGGYLNLMTHDRETIVVAAPNDRREFCFSNIERSHSPMVLKLDDWTRRPGFTQEWTAFIDDPDTRAALKPTGGEWRNYLLGAMLSIQHRFPGQALRGLYASVGSDIPMGAGLSSSAALCVAAQSAVLALNGLTLPSDAERITAARDAEWFCGARVGLSDPGALVLGGRNTLVSIALPPTTFSTDTARRFAWPEDLVLFVADSFTRRSLSGEQRMEFIRNRFAYSIALEVFVHELERMGMAPSEAAVFRSLDAMKELHPKTLFAALRAVPVEAEVESLPQTYTLPAFEESFAHYFGGVPESLRPRSLLLRGPLVYGIAESERARTFVDLLSGGDYDAAGRAMSTGHDGDRIASRAGEPFSCDVSDEVLDSMRDSNIPIADCPGNYRASTPALDVLVDTALEAGAVGACLTGAGMGGSILALCRRSSALEVEAALREVIGSDRYRELASLRGTPERSDLQSAVLENRATAGAGELILP